MRIEATDISTTASAAAIVFEALRKAIIEGELKDGDPLRQDEIAKMFNTSRIPVREAITRLEQQGLVTTQRFKGAVVAGISPKEVGEIFDFRSLLEGEVVAAAVPQMTKETLKSARNFCERFFSSTDPMEWGALNRDFHFTLYRDSHLAYHLRIVENSLDRIDRYLRAQLALTDGMMRANEEHLAILEACERADAEAAARRTRAHIQGAKKTLLEHLTAHGQPR